MSATPRHEWIDDTRRIVVKIGSRILVDEQHLLDECQVASLVDQMAALRATGREVICVTSGAVAAGVGEMGLTTRPRDLPSLQAAAAAGQARLIGLYRQLFAKHDLPVGQVLLTHADLAARDRHLNARNTLNRLLAGGVVPIINENDTVAVDEIRVGDNDLLSGLVACLMRADLLVLLTNVDGLLDRTGGDGPDQLVANVKQITEETFAMAGPAESSLTTGGMKSKLQAAQMVTRAGEWALIANGRTPDVLTRIFAGEPLGTVFEPGPQRLGGRKRWIAFFDHPRGELHVDAGAVTAICKQGRSLLPVGMQRVAGDFDRGAVVRIVDPAGMEIARGLVNFPSGELRRLVGRRTDEIAAVLGACEYEEVVHRDNLVVR